MAHISGQQCVFLPSLIHGATVVLLKQFTAAGALDIIERVECTYVFSVPACLQLMAEE